LLSVILAAESKVGSNLIIITDGIANLGIGKFSNKDSPITEDEK
jgi:hypothetical protein